MPKAAWDRLESSYRILTLWNFANVIEKSVFDIKLPKAAWDRLQLYSLNLSNSQHRIAWTLFFLDLSYNGVESHFMNSNSYPHFIPGCRMQSQIKNWYSILGCRRQLGIASSFFLSNSQHRNAWTLTLDLSYSGVLEILYTNQNPILGCRRQPWFLLSLILEKAISTPISFQAAEGNYGFSLVSFYEPQFNPTQLKVAWDHLEPHFWLFT